MNFDAQIHAATLKAEKELEHVTLAEVQIATAFTWCGRAIAAYKIALQLASPASWWIKDAGEYEHEALEHAALAGPDVYAAVHAHLDVVRAAVADAGLL
jgi:hypothetical protein